jgi:NAD(P) transhydrogenase
MMSQYDFDLVVIGGGPAGEKGAAQAAYFGYKTALVERDPELGGACINTGTLASKTLRESALFLSGFKARQLYGIQANVRTGKDITLADFMYRKNLVQHEERLRAARNLERHKIEWIHGMGTLADPHTVLVNSEAAVSQAAPPRGGSGGGPQAAGAQRKLTARHVLLCTGSTPARPPGIPFNNESVFDSDTVLQMRRLPRSMTVIGGGVIGCEYAGIFAALGIEITLVHRTNRVLDFIDYEIGDGLMDAMRKMGIRFILEDNLDTAAVETQSWDRQLVRMKLKSGHELATEALLYAAGRSGNTKGLGVDKLGIPTGKYGHIEKVNPVTYQTTVPNVYAAGDVIGAPALASTSMEQARLAMCHAFGLTYKTQLAPILPYGIYTIPEISCAGMSEEQCRKEGVQYVVGRSRFRDHARGQIIGDENGMLKLIFSAPEGKLLGVHVIGEMSSELVHIGMGCLHFGGGVDFFIQSVFNYPTLSDVYKYAAYDALGQLNKIRAAAGAGVPGPAEGRVPTAGAAQNQGVASTVR